MNPTTTDHLIRDIATAYWNGDHTQVRDLICRRQTQQTAAALVLDVLDHLTTTDPTHPDTLTIHHTNLRAILGAWI